MKLLIVTQVVDKKHPVLGFFHRWLEEFAKHYEEVHVVCLQKGEFNLPQNVFVHSLGKEGKPASGLVYTWRIIKLAWQLRSRYDCVFVHMNPEYVLAGSSIWLLLRKPIYLWYTHGSVSVMLKLASYLVTNIFTAAKEGMNLVSKKVVVTGHGIDIPDFSQSQQERDLDLITVGRISRSKNLQDLLTLLEAVRHKYPAASLTIIGVAANTDGQQYQEELRELVKEKGLDAAVRWVGGIPHSDVSKWLCRAKVFVHTAQNGSLDKVLLEALAAGTPVVSSAVGACSLPLENWLVDDGNQMAQQTLSVMEHYPETEMKRLKTYIAEHHGLPSLVESLALKMR